MKPLKQFLDHMSTAAHNLLVALITPQYRRADQQAADEFCEKMRGMGESPAAALRNAAMFAAVGMSEDDAMVFAKIAAKRAVTAEDINQLAYRGYLFPYTFNPTEPR